MSIGIRLCTYHFRACPYIRSLQRLLGMEIQWCMSTLSLRNVR